MEKRGQVYLLTTIILVLLISSFVVVVNYSKERSTVNINYLGEELNIESEKVLDYGLNNGVNLKTLLENFTKSYVTHSDIDNSYFVCNYRKNTRFFLGAFFFFFYYFVFLGRKKKTVTFFCCSYFNFLFV